MHFLFEHTKHRTFTSKYITFIENSLNDLGLTYIFNITLQETNVIKATIRRIKKTLQDQWLQALDSQLTTSGKTIFYRSITANLRSVPLYLEILPYQYRCLMTRFRLSNHHLPIETGRWRNIERSHRVCPLCNLNQIGDEFHYLYQCPILDRQRKLFLPKWSYDRPNTFKSNQLFNTNNETQLNQLARFISEINTKLLQVRD